MPLLTTWTSLYYKLDLTGKAPLPWTQPCWCYSTHYLYEDSLELFLKLALKVPRTNCMYCKICPWENPFVLYGQNIMYGDKNEDLLWCTELLCTIHVTWCSSVLGSGSNYSDMVCETTYFNQLQWIYVACKLEYSTRVSMHTLLWTLWKWMSFWCCTSLGNKPAGCQINDEQNFPSLHFSAFLSPTHTHNRLPHYPNLFQLLANLHYSSVDQLSILCNVCTL